MIGALRRKQHPTHFNVDQAVEVSRKIGPRQTLLTHISHDLDFEATQHWLPKDVALSYDGLRVAIEIPAADLTDVTMP